MMGKGLRAARVLAVIAATVISLACGTNVDISAIASESTALIQGQYAYSAWAPAFAEKLRLSSTDSNLIVSTLFGKASDI